MSDPTNIDSPDFDLCGYQTDLSHRLLTVIMSEADRLTLNRRKPSLDEIRAAGDDIVFAAMAREQAIFGDALGVNLVRGATHVLDVRASDMGVVSTCMSAYMLARVRYREQLL